MFSGLSRVPVFMAHITVNTGCDLKEDDQIYILPAILEIHVTATLDILTSPPTLAAAHLTAILLSRRAVRTAL